MYQLRLSKSIGFLKDSFYESFIFIYEEIKELTVDTHQQSGQCEDFCT